MSASADGTSSRGPVGPGSLSLDVIVDAGARRAYSIAAVANDTPVWTSSLSAEQMYRGTLNLMTAPGSAFELLPEVLWKLCRNVHKGKDARMVAACF